MFTFPIISLLVLGLATTALGDEHRLCACTNTEGNAIDGTLTSTAADNKGSFVIGLKIWTADEGAPLAGKYRTLFADVFSDRVAATTALSEEMR
ncbi:hypothetical protein CGMCC3_g15987 [Colletotrichum fructicola]|nr:uncharacterized protein CGMCC3_g15987 [Colletotrichum fructicola]KAE9567884.1 hypothetical protein CGMCC3_g15987 [Colletotrichum fructicola]